MFSEKIHIPHLISHETKFSALKKFLAVFAVLIIYFLFVYYKYGAKEGILITWLTWSFFVLCTPIADAGFLLDFPIRVITRIKMLYTEILVWAIAIVLNLYTYFNHPELYEKVAILKIFHRILSQPDPYWVIIGLSAIGTFLSVYFGDELVDKIYHHERRKYHRHKNLYKIIFMGGIILLTIVVYYELINSLGIRI